jgi:hypothetical protein
MPYDQTDGKNIAMFFHIDYSFQPPYLKPLWKGLEKTFCHHLKKVDAIVTISKFWQNHFLERGYPLEDLRLLDLFPQSYHMEVVALLRSPC